jgi:hypothetical protein
MIAVPVIINFVFPEDRDVPVRGLEAETVEDSSGIRIRVGWEVLPRTKTVARDTADMKWAKLAVLLRLLSMNPNADTLAKTCVRWSDKPQHALPPSMLRRIRAQYPEVVNADACPRTYWSMAQIVDSEGSPAHRKPRGHVNPVWVTVGVVDPWTPDLYLVKGYVVSGGTHSYSCEARRDERGRWAATCELRSTTMY